MNTNMHTYVIGEIGQNHNGSVDIAKLIVDLVARPVREELFDLDLQPMDAIKLTKRDLKEELSQSEMEKVYESPHSFGRTYGEHRAFLELSDEAHFDIYKHAKSKGLDFVETICAVGAMSILKYFQPDYIKVASRDLTNLPLLAALAEATIPMIVSTGMGGKKELNDALNEITRYHSNVSILHCVSQYPAMPRNVNLRTITYLREAYPDYRVGYSDHTIGISAAVAAVALGAEIIEKHVTIDRRMKGTDQACSLGPDGVNRMIRDIRLTEQSLGSKDIFICDDVQAAKNKLERSIASNRLILSGEIIQERDLHLLSPGSGVRWNSRNLIVGKRAVQNIPRDEIIFPTMVG